MSEKKKKNCESFGYFLTSVPYGFLDITSGAIQYGVPTRDFLLGISSVTCAQKPKSESFTYKINSKKKKNE